MEVGIIEREEWRSVETSSGGESVMMTGMKMMLLLCADNLDFQMKVWHINNIMCVAHYMSIRKTGAEAIIKMQSTPEWYGPSTLSFFALDDVGCNGSESNLLDCLPQHNCGMDRGTENAGVQCLRKGLDEKFLSFLHISTSS